MEISFFLRWIREKKGISPIIEYWKKELKSIDFEVNKVKGDIEYFHPNLIEFLEDIDSLPFILKLFGFDLFLTDYSSELIKNFRDRGAMLNKNEFLKKIEKLRKELKKFDKECYDLVKSLSLSQMDRLDEAICTYFIDSYTSTVVMAVSVIEYELFKIIKRNRKILRVYEKKYKKIEKATFGQLLSFFQEVLNYKDSENLFEKKYKRYFYWLKESSPLLDLCNKYRVDSAHLKKRPIDRLIAESILNLTFHFFISKPEEYKKQDSKQNIKSKNIKLRRK